MALLLLPAGGIDPRPLPVPDENGALHITAEEEEEKLFVLSTRPTPLIIPQQLRVLSRVLGIYADSN